MTSLYDPTTALVVVDVQNDFADPRGGLYVAGGEEIVPLANEEIRAARRAGATVVYSQDWHPEHTPHFVTDGGTWPVHCVQGTWGAQLHPDLVVDGPVIRKGTGGEDGYSAFSARHPTSGEESATELDAVLREAGARSLVVVGLAGDVCVKETALDGRRHGYEVTLLADATRHVELEAGDADRALAEMADAGVTVHGWM
ncbi:isochorismatase family protein [Actinomycetospora cinnamomea]|uniref:nicotinamidase n=1 Tax=Actinomycetospora cinnamomea TaxID=663609 RepID=A0A2U1FI69_9PSEU|nr:isochorismatase family protein [Actinomycetospora cinnamomea]PVZ11851.1 nicotinamidase/pyrazinamidase [Actinomycetospora cinnamomea]